MYLHGRAVAPNTARQQAKELKASPATMTSSQHDAISPATVWALLPLQALPSLGLPQRKSSRNLSTAQDLVFKAAAAFFKTKRSTRDVHLTVVTSCPPCSSREPCDVTNGQLAVPPPAALLHLLQLQAWGLGQDQR